jgi:hypothetical protein
MGTGLGARPGDSEELAVLELLIEALEETMMGDGVAFFQRL